MGKKLLLDCTLRDGGYINDWEFGQDRIIEIFERMVTSGVEVIEIGFLDDRRKFDINRAIMPDTESANKIFAGVDKGNAIVVAMIDYGTVDIKNLQPCKDTFIDGLRIIFKEQLMHEALAYCAEVKKLGYKVFAQMVSVTTYTDKTLKEYCKLVNNVMPYGNAMVDTYGLLKQKDLMKIFTALDKYLDPKIIIGYHAHNNFQLGFANCMEFLEAKTKRTILVDGTLYGMGKSAGNAPIELLAMHMNEHCNKKYDVGQMLEAIDNVVLDIYSKQYWGYNLFFYVAAATKCHPNYVSYLMDKKTLSVQQITDILHGITEAKKLMYDAKYIEKVYLKYQNIKCDDKKALTELKKEVKNKEVLLIGPGNNIIKQKSKVKKCIADNKPLTIAVNYAPKDIKVDYVFLTKAKRYTQVLNELKSGINADADIIATSNVCKTNGTFKYVLNYGSLIDEKTDIIDNSLVMLLKAMQVLGVKNISLAGFDGYSKRSDNYFDTSREYSFAKDKADYLNAYVVSTLKKLKGVKINFVTNSKYLKK